MEAVEIRDPKVRPVRREPAVPRELPEPQDQPEPVEPLDRRVRVEPRELQEPQDQPELQEPVEPLEVAERQDGCRSQRSWSHWK